MSLQTVTTGFEAAQGTDAPSQTSFEQVGSGRTTDNAGLSPDDLRGIDAAAARLIAHDERYSEAAQKMVDR